MIRDEQLIEAVYGQPWAIVPSKLAQIDAFCRRRLAGDGTPRGDGIDDETRAEIQAARHRGRPKAIHGGVAVLSIVGVMVQRAGEIEESSGVIGTDRLGRVFDGLVADDSIGAIVLDVDSPGGQVAGASELSGRIFAARETKPVIAIVNSTMASAAFWVASAASEVSITPSGLIGSVGTFWIHTDTTALNEKLGIKPTLISAGKYKSEDVPFEPLTDEAKAHLQSIVDNGYSRFVGDLARNRGVKRSVVESDFGQGRIVTAQAAVAAGMADRVETLDQLLGRLGVRTSGQSAARADGTPRGESAGRSVAMLRRRERIRERGHVESR